MSVSLATRVLRSFLAIFVFALAIAILLARLTHFIHDLFNLVRLDGLSNGSNLAWSVLLKLERIGHKVVLVNQFVGLLTDADGAGHAIAFHLVSDEDVLAKDVVPDNLGANDSTHNLSRVDTDPHVQVPQRRVLGLVSLLGNDIDHLKTDLDDSEGLFDLHDG